MKTTIAISTLLVVGAGAASAGALPLPNPYQGSDTLFDVTRNVLTSLSLTSTAYTGGGSGNAESAMEASPATQTTGPMSRMMKGSGVCGFQGGSNGSKATNASSLVIALDAVDILGSTLSSSSATCGGGAAGGNGMVNSGTTASGYPITNWKSALALIYGGLNTSTGVVDCNQSARISLVANWAQLFQNASCTNGSSACGDGNHDAATGSTGIGSAVALWHAYRRDEASGTSDVFSSILGISPSTSQSSLNGFGASPYCNALNWDTTNNNSGTCLLKAAANGKAAGAFDPHSQFTGPGGVADPGDTSGKGHRLPPPGLNGLQVWGALPDPTTETYKSSPVVADVLPTDMQDNDPIRRACFGGAVKVAGHVGEDVCNIDGSLGLVLPMVDTDFVLNLPDPVNAGATLQQYPQNLCSGSFINSVPPSVFSCAPHNDIHAGECPNGDTPASGACVSPIASGTGQCTANNATVAGAFTRTAAGNADGRAFNTWLTNGSLTDGGVAFIQQNIPADLGVTLDLGGVYSRIHQVDVTVAGETACQMVDMTDQIGCLGQADPCSFGYAGDGGKGWNTHPVTKNVCPGTTANKTCDNSPTLPATAGVDAANILGIYPQTSSVQLLGLADEYPLSRKLYFASLPGFSTVTSDELNLAEFESGNTPGGPSPITAFNTIITNNNFFLLGNQAAATGTATTPPGGVVSTAGMAITNPTTPVAGQQFCEDFNEAVVCNPTPGTATTTTNVNGCLTNPSKVNSAYTICGDGKRQAYEECDDGANNGTTGDTCSNTCRCTTFLDNTTGNCH